MIRLVFKIFLAYWFAAGVVIAISDFEPHRHIHNPELTDALTDRLAINGFAILDAYEAGRCLEFERFLETRDDALYLASPNGTLLCGDPGIDDIRPLIVAAATKQKRMTSNYALFQLIATQSSPERDRPILHCSKICTVQHFRSMDCCLAIPRSPSLAL